MTAAGHFGGDEHLVTRLVDGDQAALGAVYDRYADRIHDFCARMLHDPAEAADATHDAFLVAARRAGSLRDRSKLRPWLYAIARTQCLARLRARRRTEPTDDLEPMMGGDQPGRGAEQADVASLVHAAAAGLEDRDRAALHLHLRHDLDGQALADAMGVTPANARKIAQRVRDRLERSLTALVVARQGSDDCDELAAVLGDWDGELTPLLRKRVSRHVDDCEVCDDRKRRALTPAALLAAMPLAPAPADLRGRVISSSHFGGAPTGSEPTGWDSAGFPAADATPQKWLALAVAGLMVVAAFVGGAVFGALRDDEAVLETVSAPRSTTTTTVESTSTTVPSTSTSTAAVAPPTTRPRVSIVPVPPVTAPADRTPPTLEATADPTTIWSTGGHCPGPYESTVAAEVADDAGIRAVRFRWQGASEVEQRLVTDAPFEVTVGPFPAGHANQQGSLTRTIEVEAFDTAGNLSADSVDLTIRPANDCLY